ncbi:MAG: Flp family type IVb pilin [Alphaproteobacteria bacterium]|nr:Flp family type IVb pilin [Alphaproteobacteria bacterium]
MLRMYIKAQELKRNISGATAIEYGLIAAGIAVAIITVVFQFGDDLADLFTGISGKITENTPS